MGLQDIASREIGACHISRRCRSQWTRCCRRLILILTNLRRLYDQPQLLNTYLDAYILNPTDPILLSMVHDIATYLTTPPLANSSGGFFSSEDADSLYRPSDVEKREGAFYVWTLKEFQSILGERDAPVLAAYYGVESDGNVAPEYDAHDELLGQNVLAISASREALSRKFGLSVAEVDTILKEGKRKLKEHREKERPRPALDDKIVTAWNGLAIGALARTAATLTSIAQEASAAQSYLQSAIDAANFIRKELYDEQKATLKRVYRQGAGDVPGFADDYAFLISGLIDLYEATFDDTWLEWADTLQQSMIQLFWDESTTEPAKQTERTSTTADPTPADTQLPTSANSQTGIDLTSQKGHGGFFSTPVEAPDLLLRLKDGMDNAEPGTNGIACLNLFRLAALFEDDSYKAKARATLHAFEAEIIEHPFLFVSCLAGVAWNCADGKSVTIYGGSGTEVDGVLKALRAAVRPNISVCRLDGEGVKSEWLRKRNRLLSEIALGSEKARSGVVMVCEHGACRETSFTDVGSLL